MVRVTQGQAHSVDQFDLSGRFIKRWNSATEAANYFGTSQGNISNAARGERKTAQGYVWRYCEAVKLVGEFWKPHPRLNIRTSNLGRVSLNSDHATYGQALRDGYFRIRVGHNIDRKNYSVHRLIAETWFPNAKLMKDRLCQGRSQVDHIDGNPSNNRIENLAWVTPSENIIRRYSK